MQKWVVMANPYALLCPLMFSADVLLSGMCPCSRWPPAGRLGNYEGFSAQTPAGVSLTTAICHYLLFCVSAHWQLLRSLCACGPKRKLTLVSMLVSVLC